MKFIHMADMHLDCPFSSLNQIEHLGELRRIEQREIFKNIIEMIKKENIQALFISGDLYEHSTVRKSTIDFINSLFQTIPDTRIFIAPGNHDPYIAGSYYATYSWSENVHIFTPEIEKIETPEAEIYGYGFDDFYCSQSKVESLLPEDNSKLKILVVHGNLDGKKEADNEYNPLSSRKLKQAGWDYVALGHIHKRSENQEIPLIYSGSTISFGFDELGSHGVIFGQTQQKEVKIEFLPFDTREFEQKRIDVTPFLTQEELIEALHELELTKNHLYKVILEGYRQFEIDVLHLRSFLTNPQIVKWKDRTKRQIPIQTLLKEETLRGIFVRKMVEKMKENPEQKEQIEKAIEIGLDSLEG